MFAQPSPVYYYHTDPLQQRVAAAIVHQCIAEVDRQSQDRPLAVDRFIFRLYLCRNIYNGSNFIRQLLPLLLYVGRPPLPIAITSSLARPRPRLTVMCLPSDHALCCFYDARIPSPGLRYLFKSFAKSLIIPLLEPLTVVFHPEPEIHAAKVRASVCCTTATCAASALQYSDPSLRSLEPCV
jgi:hypothetical protein